MNSKEWHTRDLEFKLAGTGSLMGSSDTVPAGTPIENLKAVAHTLEEHGAYPLLWNADRIVEQWQNAM